MEHLTEDQMRDIDKIKKFITDRGHVYFLAAEEFPTPDTYLGPAAGCEYVTSILSNSQAVIFFYPDRVVTGALVEVGYALALNLPVLTFVRDRNSLPYMLREELPGRMIIRWVENGINET